MLNTIAARSALALLAVGLIACGAGPRPDSMRTQWQRVGAAELASLRIAAQPTTITLVEGGRSDYTILLPRAADWSTSVAAAKVQQYVHEVGGARPPIRREPTDSPGPFILIGPTERTLANVTRAELSGLGPRGVFIRTVGPHLVLAGADPRGQVYSAYVFAERVLGVRFLTWDATWTPERETIRIEPPAIAHTPTPEYGANINDDRFVRPTAEGFEHFRDYYQRDAFALAQSVAEFARYRRSHLSWDPARDRAAIRAEFCEAYYGPAAGPVRAYLGLVTPTPEADPHLNGLPADARRRAVDLLREARRVVEYDGDEPRQPWAARLEPLWPPVWLEIVRRPRRYGVSREGALAAVRDLRAFAREHGLLEYNLGPRLGANPRSAIPLDGWLARREAEMTAQTVW